MSKKAQYLVISSIVSVFSFFGCQNSLSKDEYVHWVLDYNNGLHVNKKFGEYLFDVQYQPRDFIRILRNDFNFDDSLEYFTLQIHLKDSTSDFMTYHVSNVVEKQQRLYYFSYLFQDGIFLEEANEKHPCVLYHFEQADVLHKRTFILAFEKSASKQIKEAKLIIDSPYFGSLPIAIKISKVNIPSLKL
jgi:hypothetical protein